MVSCREHPGPSGSDETPGANEMPLVVFPPTQLAGSEVNGVRAEAAFGRLSLEFGWVSPAGRRVAYAG